MKVTALIVVFTLILNVLALNYTEIISDIVCVIPTGSSKGNTLGGFVRLVFHDAAGGGGGPNGCYDATDAQNKGLAEFSNELEPIFLKYQASGLTRADLWTLAGYVSVYVAGGPAMAYSSGRIDCNPSSPPSDAGLLPGPTMNFSQVLAIMQTRMGFTPREITALMGAHSLGGAELANSGIQGPEAINDAQFSNTYYQDTFNQQWTLNQSSGASTEFWQAEQGQIIRFDTDINLVIDPASCNEFGGATGVGRCNTNPITHDRFQKYANNQTLWFADFSEAFQKLVALGYSDLTPVQLSYPPRSLGCVPSPTPAPTPAPTPPPSSGKTNSAKSTGKSTAPAPAPAPAGKGKTR